LSISGVEVSLVEGHREVIAGVNGQHQMNPLDVYEEYPQALQRLARRREDIEARNEPVALPERPGFGIELDPAKVEKQSQMTWS